MATDGYVFDFERLNVYQKAVNFTNRVFKLTGKFPREIQYSLGDQFRCAALSVCNNLTEGSRKTLGGRKQFYGYAFDSARECIPMITISVLQERISIAEESDLRSECIQICNMLYKLIQTVG
jgi:four helix bundle protein